MYSLTISSVIFPELTARYPLAQKWRPQNLLRRCGNSCSSTRELIPLSHCIIWLTSWLGRYPTKTCTWSRATFPEMISNSDRRQFAESNPAPELPLLPLKRVFGISATTPNALSSRSWCALPIGICARTQFTHFTSPEGEGFQPSPKETLIFAATAHHSLAIFFASSSVLAQHNAIWLETSAKLKPASLARTSYRTKSAGVLSSLESE